MFAFRAKKAAKNTAIHDDDIQSENLGRRFSFADIISATDNFRQEIGQGGWGKVYKGRIDGGSTTVAVKRLRSSSSQQGETEFFAELKTLSKLQHINFINLIGYCKRSDEMILVYEYMPNGSLADQLHKIRGRENYGVDIDAFPLTWERRLNICLGVARGLAYLHAGTRQCFVHRDVKPGNILLDEDWTPKVSDFGLSIDISDGNSVSHIAGTPGYLSPEYVCDGRVSDKADVYAFALVMLEVLSGRRLRVSDSMNLVDWALQCISEGRLDSIIDPSLGRQVSDDCLKCFVQVAVESLNRNPEERPTMSEVVWNLQLALKCQKQGTFTKVFSDITPSFDNIWRGCRNYGPSDDGYLQVLSRCSTKFQSPTLLLDRSFGIKSPGDVHLKPPSPNGTTQGVGQNSKAASDVHMKSLLSSTTQIVDKNMGSEYSLNDGIVIGQNCSSEVHKTSIGSLRSASILHLESISISSSGIMDKNFGSGSSRDVHLKPPFAESITSRQGRSSESASNVHMEPVSNNTVGTVHKDFGGGSSGDVHLQPPSTKSTTQMEGRSSRTKSDVHVKSQSKSTTHIVDKNIGSVLSMDTHREPPLAESTTDESANKNFESGSSRDGHCEPISDNTAKQYAFHSLTNGRGAIRYYFDDSVVIGQDCSSKVYRTCIDRPKKKGNTEDEKKPKGHQKNPFTWSTTANRTTLWPWKARKHISNLYMTIRFKRASNVREIISQGRDSRVLVDQDSTEKVPHQKAVVDDVEVINYSVPSQHHDETIVFNKPCEDKIEAENIANGLEVSPNNCTTIHEKQTDIRSEEGGNEVELVMTDVVVVKKEESKISHGKILYEEFVSHTSEIKTPQGKKSRLIKEKQEIIGDNEKNSGASTSMGSSCTSLVLDQGDDKGIKVIKNMGEAITLKDQFGVQVKIDFEALTKVKVNIRPILLRIIELRPHTFIQIGKVSSSFVKLIMEHIGGLLELLDRTVLREASGDAFDEMLHMLEDLKRNLLNVDWLEDSVRAMSNHIKFDSAKSELSLTILKIIEYEEYLAELKEKKCKLEMEVRHLEKQPLVHLDMDGTAAQVLF